MKIAMACDHAGFGLKEEIKALLQKEGHEVVDFGTDSEASCDLPDYIYPAALAVGRQEVERGIFVDGVGYGSAMIANKVPGVYAAVCQDPFCAQLARSHSDTNVLCIGGKIIGSAIAAEIVKVWMATAFLADVEKYAVRVEKVKEIGRKHLVW
ncbi:RpiB/LacA/LacB family sugar-phosphate isomerase [Anaerotalea alkaliphila]|uniref:RpiB/LacA/LacB family sugar-phosphate isomerase n=1 Tax=Anaerotalea alkaliphila TaxID=2662126 RepID=A0A7X5KNP9_9FIRM|nr:RpiB/LacA/LacB family sugar-phosphate isomerase [Anaerotalea alkaliphila]NDL68028.1 RpiB/LacA/LacB family sugar-phosphate isomerase [Anaerotalea alkaliphila]